MTGDDDGREPMLRAELTEAEYLWDMAEGVPDDLAERLGTAGLRVGGGVVRVVRNDPAGGFWNRSIGLGMTEPITGDVVDEAIEFSRANGAPVMVFQVAPGAQPQGWEEVFAERGIAMSAQWVKFMGPPPRIPDVDTDLRIAPLDKDDAAQVREFSEVMIASFGMPPGLMTEWGQAQARRPDWAAFAAWDGDRIVSASLLYVHGDTGHLIGAGTLPDVRGRGAQSALMKARIDEAVRRGCAWVGSETGAETPESPNPSLHNMRRLGLTELYHRGNWVWRP